MSNFHARHCCDGCQTKSRARGRPASRIARDAGGERRHLAPVQDAVGVRVCPPEEARQPVAPHGLVGVDDAIAVLVELCEELVGQGPVPEHAALPIRLAQDCGEVELLRCQCRVAADVRPLEEPIHPLHHVGVVEVPLQTPMRDELAHRGLPLRPVKTPVGVAIMPGEVGLVARVEELVVVGRVIVHGVVQGQRHQVLSEQDLPLAQDAVAVQVRLGGDTVAHAGDPPVRALGIHLLAADPSHDIRPEFLLVDAAVAVQVHLPERAPHPARVRAGAPGPGQSGGEGGEEAAIRTARCGARHVDGLANAAGHRQQGRRGNEAPQARRHYRESARPRRAHEQAGACDWAA
mmetsp:Transcript_93005/g.260010  ORF Transcript_93005/g.260010 Transcript_93005/m.260010 type:complete len:348 (+) Transcript_93005:3-1046(+)